MQVLTAGLIRDMPLKNVAARAAATSIDATDSMKITKVCRDLWTTPYRFTRRKFYFLSSFFARSTSLQAEFSVRRVSSTFPLRWYS